jgi:hypothetical protein
MAPATKVNARSPESVTALLEAWNAGDEQAGRRLIPLVCPPGSHP